MRDSRVRRIYQRAMFAPGLLGLLVNPFYFVRKGLAAHVEALAGQVTGRTLDVGCGTKPYAHLFRADEYVGLEIDSPHARAVGIADCYYDGQRMPFGDRSFDSVVASEVLEHVFEPRRFLGEIARVLKPGGTLLLTTPFVWDEHEQPHDFARYSSFGIRFLLESEGFEVVELRKATDDIRAIFQMLNAYTYKRTVTRNRWVNLALTVVLMAPVNILGEALSLVTPRNPDLYLGSVALARRAR